MNDEKVIPLHPQRKIESPVKELTQEITEVERMMNILTSKLERIRIILEKLKYEIPNSNTDS